MGVCIRHREVTIGLLPRAATTDTSELGTELAWCAILLSTIVSPTVVLAVATGSAVGPLTTTAAAASSPLSGARANGLAMCLWDDFCRKVEPFAEVLESLGGKGVIVPLPREPRLDVTARGEGLKHLDHLEVWDVQFLVLWGVEIFFRHHDTLYMRGEGRVRVPAVEWKECTTHL
jgi:hypothetical protein